MYSLSYYELGNKIDWGVSNCVLKQPSDRVKP